MMVGWARLAQAVGGVAHDVAGIKSQLRDMKQELGALDQKITLGAMQEAIGSPR